MVFLALSVSKSEGQSTSSAVITAEELPPGMIALSFLFPRIPPQYSSSRTRKVVPIGATFRVLLDEYCGGMRGNKKLKAIIPGGSSSAVMTAEEVDWPSDFDTLKAKKTMAGSGGVVYLDEDTNMAFALANVMRFYAHESCGQCTPCREGTAWLSRLLDKICAGRGEKLDVDNVHQIARQMEMKTICALADGAAMPAKSYIEKFRADFDALVRG